MKSTAISRSPTLRCARFAAPLRSPRRGFFSTHNDRMRGISAAPANFLKSTTMSPINSSPAPQAKRGIYFAADGVSIISLPVHDNETLSLIDSAGGDIRLLRVAPADAEQITVALGAGATFRLVKNTLHVAAPSGRLEFSAHAPDGAAAGSSALPSPSEIQRLHENSTKQSIQQNTTRN